jgi:hypothetical protein
MPRRSATWFGAEMTSTTTRTGFLAEQSWEFWILPGEREKCGGLIFFWTMEGQGRKEMINSPTEIYPISHGGVNRKFDFFLQMFPDFEYFFT